MNIKFSGVFAQVLMKIEEELKPTVCYERGRFYIAGIAVSKDVQRRIVEEVLVTFQLEHDELYEIQEQVYNALCLNGRISWSLDDKVVVITNQEVDEESTPSNVNVITIQKGIKLIHYYALGRRTAGDNVYIDIYK